MHWLVKSASDVYALDYFGIIIVMSLLEYAIPRREAGITLRLRWVSNFGISIISTIALRLLFPLVGVGWATLCRERGWGLFNQFASPAGLPFVLTFFVLDLGAYGQHFVLHRAPWLWRLHRAHHTDHDCDFSTAVRFHPLESVFTNVVTLGVIGLAGAPPLAVFVSQLVSAAIGFVEHGNVRVPNSLDRIVRFLLVTPDMHRIHHSQEAGEMLVNYGGTFTWWDRLFGTYRDQAARGPAGIVFGVEGFEGRKHQTLPWILAQPFLHEHGSDSATEAIPQAAQASNLP
jgi:sterol desaturase/sphingolipid hydroxylase (fatty acid hydroxylase superfamily)